MANDFISQVTLPDNQTYDLKDADAARADHGHGNISTTGTLSTSSTIAKNDAIVIATTANSGKITKTSITFDGSTTSAVLSKKGTWVDMYTHPTSAGNNHLPSGGSSGQFLAWNTGSTGQWVNNPNTDTKVNVKLATTSKAYLLGTTTTPTSTTSALEAISDTGVYLGTTAGYIHATKFVGDLQGTASKATGDGDGNQIKTTYLKLSGGTVTGTTASSSTSTGALVVQGGIATQATSYFQKSVHILGNASDDPLIVRGISGCSNNGNIGNDAVNWGLYLNYNRGAVYLGQPSSTAATNYVQVYSEVDSTTSTSGAFIVAGGVGIAKNLYVGSAFHTGDITIGGDTNEKRRTISSSNTLYLNRPSTYSIIFRAADTGVIQIDSDNNFKPYNATNTLQLGTSANNWAQVYSKKYTVENKVTLQWNNTTESLDFIFES